MRSKKKKVVKEETFGGRRIFDFCSCKDFCLDDELTQLLPMLYKVDTKKFETYVEGKTLTVGNKIKLRFLDYERMRELARLSDDWDNDDCNPQHFAFLQDSKKMFKYTLY
jgi:hypothetical protein